MSKNKSRKPNWLLRRIRKFPRTMLKSVDERKLREYYGQSMQTPVHEQEEVMRRSEGSVRFSVPGLKYLIDGGK